MNLEQKLRDTPVDGRQDHKAALKGALLANMKESQQMKKKSKSKLLWFVPAVMVASIALLVGVNFWPMQQDQQGSQNQNPIVQSLTPQQVFAASAEQARKFAEQNGNFFMQNRVFTYEEERSEGGCYIYDQEEIDAYDLDGNLVLAQRYGAFDAHGLTLIEKNNFETGENYFDLQASFDSRRVSEKCQQYPMLTDKETDELFAFYGKIATAFGFEGTDEKPKVAGGNIYLGALISGDPEKQAETLEKLKTIGEWKYTLVTDDNSMANGEDYIQLRVSFGQAYTELYFNAKSKAFIGYRDYMPLNGYTSRIVKEQKKINDLSEAVPKVKMIN